MLNADPIAMPPSCSVTEYVLNLAVGVSMWRTATSAELMVEPVGIAEKSNPPMLMVAPELREALVHVP